MTLAVVLERREQLALEPLDLRRAAADDVVVDIDWSGISTGTERLLWTGRMPPFPGMGYPLVPGYESVGRVRRGRAATRAARSARRVFVPGARCFGEVRGLFGGAASQLVVPGARARADRRDARRARRPAGARRHRPPRPRRRAAAPRPDRRPRRARPAARPPRGRRRRAPPTVWETQPDRARRRATATRSSIPTTTRAATIASICDVSGDADAARHADRAPRARRRDRARRLLRGAALLRLPAGLHARGAPPRRGRMAAAPTSPPSSALVDDGRLSLDGLITHRAAARGRAGRLPHRLRRPRLPEDDPRLESTPHERSRSTQRLTRTRSAPRRRSSPMRRADRRRRRRRRRSSRSTARAASARASRSPTSPT